MTGHDRSFRRVAIIGAGTMGAGIAALLVNAGVQVDLLDIVPDAPTQEEVETGLGLSDQQVRDRIAREGWARARASRQAKDLSPEAAERVSIGNLEDDLGRLSQADWVIEAVVEDLSVKRQIMARIEAARRPDAVISTNTSGLLLREIVAGRSAEYSRRFLGTHFFNPPTTMELVELIPGPRTDRAIVRSMMKFLEGPLAKRVVVCKDTPNFIANRLASVQSSFDMAYVLKHGYTVEEADAILGPLVGRPSTAVFRLRDLVGLDVSTRVAENLHQAIPHDPFRQILVEPRLSALRNGMLERGLLGRKSGGGFYRAEQSDQERTFLPIDLDSLKHVRPRTIDLPRLSQAREMDHLADRLRFLVSENDRVGDLVWASLSNVMAYAAYCVPEIADGPGPIDQAMRWGYSWQMGPFEMWDAIGLASGRRRMDHDGLVVAEWVDDMLSAGYESFHKMVDGTLHAYSPTAKAYLPV
jgi:3-hydroxyacyl-CoA dehydrogenase